MTNKDAEAMTTEEILRELAFLRSYRKNARTSYRNLQAAYAQKLRRIAEQREVILMLLMNRNAEYLDAEIQRLSSCLTTTCEDKLLKGINLSINSRLIDKTLVVEKEEE